MSTIIFYTIFLFSRQIRHIYARSSEWYRVHRSGGTGGGNGWSYLWLIAGGIVACWVAYRAFIWLVQVIQSVLQGICTCLIAAVPYVLLGGIASLAVMWLAKSRR